MTEPPSPGDGEPDVDPFPPLVKQTFQPDLSGELPKVEAVNPLSVELTPEERERRQARRAQRRAKRERHRRRRRRKRLAVIALTVLGLLLVSMFAWVRWTTGGLDRIDVSMPAGTDDPGTTILLVGSDPTAVQQPGDSWQENLKGSDLVMLVHLSADHQSMYAISLPHDLRLTIPGQPQGLLPDAYAEGGVKLYLQTVQNLIGTRIDHLAVMDLNGLREVADTLNGISISVPAAVCGDRVGARRFDGEGALEFIRLLPCYPHGDLDRVQRQQAVLKGLLSSLVDGGAITNPFKLNRIAKSTFDHLAVEQDWSLWSMAKLAWSLRGIGPTRTTFLTVPVLDNTKNKDVVRLNEPAAASLWTALRSDKIGEYLQLNNEAAVLGR